MEKQTITHWSITLTNGAKMTAHTEHGNPERVCCFPGGVLPADAFLAGVEKMKIAGAAIETSETVFEYEA